MKHIRTIVVDDEPAARARIARLLEQDAEMELVAECRNGMEAIEAVNKHRPDLIFLDVQMPQLNGIETLDRIESDRKPFVIFVTAYDQYALKAFDLIFVISGGGPGTSSETINLYLYQTAFAFYNMGYAAAMTVVFFIIILLVSLVLFTTRQQEKWQ